MSYHPNIFLVLIPIICAIIAQIIKAVVRIAQHRFNVSHLVGYGGIISAHTAVVFSLATVVALHDGIYSTTFAIAIIMAMIIIRDALGFRMYLSEHGQVLNRLVKDTLDKKDWKNYPHLREKLGHRWYEVLSGAVLGAGLSWILYYYFII